MQVGRMDRKLMRAATPSSCRGSVCLQLERNKLSLGRTTCLADKTNHPVKRLSSISINLDLGKVLISRQAERSEAWREIKTFPRSKFSLRPGLGPQAKAQDSLEDRCESNRRSLIFRNETHHSRADESQAQAWEPRHEDREYRTTCLADKTNHPVKRLSLNRSQCGSCSTKYDTSAGTEVVYRRFGASTLLDGCPGKASTFQAQAQVPESGTEAEAYPTPHKKEAQQ